jgi:hypothetical protein
MSTDRTNIAVTGVHISGNDMSIAHTPAYLVNNPVGLAVEGTSTPNAGLAIFANVVEGHTGSTHEGDLGGAA